MGLITAAGLHPDAEITFVATPVLTLVDQVKRALADTNGLVTDVGSVKGALAGSIDDPRFVGGHPMAGSELDGGDRPRTDTLKIKVLPAALEVCVPAD